MSVELLEILNDKGERTGVFKPRSAIHRSGEWHLSVHVWLIDNNRILLQKRAAEKESFPGMYDASAAGHVIAGETCEDAAVRETFEEIGVAISKQDLIYAGCRKLKIWNERTSFISNEFNHIYVVEYFKDVEFLRPDPMEIDSLVWVDIEGLKCDLDKRGARYCIERDEILLAEAAYLKSKMTEP